MSDQFLGEIRVFPYTFAPRGWALCNGARLPIAQYSALFSLMGTTYGGDGRTTFALPDLRGRAAMAAVVAGGLSPHPLGESGGTDSVYMLYAQLPAHTHALMASPDPGDNTVPGPTTSLAGSIGAALYVRGNPPTAPMAGQALQPAGGDLPHNNLQPYLTFNFCIAVEGEFPPRP